MVNGLGGDVGSEARQVDPRETMLAHLQARTPLTEIAQDMGLSVQAASYYIRRLRKDGVVVGPESWSERVHTRRAPEGRPARITLWVDESGVSWRVAAQPLARIDLAEQREPVQAVVVVSRVGPVPDGVTGVEPEWSWVTASRQRMSTSEVAAESAVPLSAAELERLTRAVAAVLDVEAVLDEPAEVK